MSYLPSRDISDHGLEHRNRQMDDVSSFRARSACLLPQRCQFVEGQIRAQTAAGAHVCHAAGFPARKRRQFTFHRLTRLRRYATFAGLHGAQYRLPSHELEVQRMNGGGKSSHAHTSAIGTSNRRWGVASELVVDRILDSGLTTKIFERVPEAVKNQRGVFRDAINQARAALAYRLRPAMPWVGFKFGKKPPLV